jgi:hypothetical protein
MSCGSVRESLLELLDEPAGSLPAPLRGHLDSCAACRDEWSEMREAWMMLGRMPEEPSSDRLRARFHAMLARETAGVRGARLLSGWTLRPAQLGGALAATLVAGILLGIWIQSREKQRDEMEALRAEMRSMTQLVTLSLLRHQSASERLRAVGLCEASPPDDELVQALLRVVSDDPSANVRLAALDVLASMPGRTDVRAGLLAAFPGQASPPVTAAMASLLLELDGAEAVEAVRSAAADDRLPGSVRDYLGKILEERVKRTGTGT